MCECACLYCCCVFLKTAKGCVPDSQEQIQKGQCTELRHWLDTCVCARVQACIRADVRACLRACVSAPSS